MKCKRCNTNLPERKTAGWIKCPKCKLGVFFQGKGKPKKTEEKEEEKEE